MLPISRPRPLKLVLNLNCVDFTFLDRKYPNMENSPETPKFEKISNYLQFTRRVSPYASNNLPTAFETCLKLQLWGFYCFGPKMPKYGKLAPNPEISDFLEIICIFSRNVSKCFP